MQQRMLDRAKKKLIKEREKLLADVNHIRSEELDKSQKNATGELSGYANHMADGGTDTIEKQISLGLISNEEAMLIRIDKALRKIEDKTYGVCELCKEKISQERLDAVSYATYCIKCRSQEENKNNNKV
ncbi:TraR/DksA C4-type zinc finger protein [bacterium]|nr:TraR/DksA C4-type zinc finger protein [bacterium]